MDNIYVTTNIVKLISTDGTELVYGEADPVSIFVNDHATVETSATYLGSSTLPFRIRDTDQNEHTITVVKRVAHIPMQLWVVLKADGRPIGSAAITRQDAHDIAAKFKEGTPGVGPFHIQKYILSTRKEKEK